MSEQHVIRAVIKNTPIRFKINPGFADLSAIGSVVRHHTLGPIFYDEAILNDDGSVNKVVFLGTSDKNGLRKP